MGECAAGEAASAQRSGCIDMGMMIYILFVIAATFVAALFWRPVVAALTLAVLICAALAAPFVYFGAMALLLGEPLGETLKGASVIIPGLLFLVRYTVMWSVVGLVCGAALRALWTFSKRKLA